jgi:GTP-binding protein EngB required for normal cell division
MNPYPLNGISSSALKEFLDKLTVDTQISNYVKLPMIAVMGDTSSGKSSLLSAISGIELPSASTLTTKCPIMLQLQKGEQVQATVKVQWRTQQQQQQQRVTPTKSPRSRKRELEQAPNGIRNNNSNNSNNNLDIRDPPPPTFEPLVITGSDDLETRLPQALQQAQDFILHYRNTLVAPDIISVRVTSPSITHDLTLVDLPGLVQFQLDEEQKQENNQNGNLLEQVQDLMHEYFDNPRCLLLAVVSAHVNIHNSRLLQLARTVDPTSSRTVVVLTKPDLVDPGSEQHVLELLQTSKHTYAPHGFHLVKNRGQAALDSGMTIAQGLKDEKTFFLETKPWNNGMADASQLGVPHVKSRLAQLQLQMIRESLPSILQEIQSQHASVQQALQELGPMYTSRVEQRRYYQSLLHDFMAHVHSQLSGKGRRPMAKPQHQPPPRPHQPLAAARLHQACTDFSHSIQAGSLATISTLVEGAQVLVTDVSCGIDIRGEIVHLDVKNQYACVDFVNPDDHTTDVLFDGLEYNTMDKHHEQQEAFQLDEVWTDGSQVYIARSEEMFDSLRKIPLRRLRTDPTWLVDKIAQYRTDDLACFLNVDIFQQASNMHYVPSP